MDRILLIDDELETRQVVLTYLRDLFEVSGTSVDGLDLRMSEFQADLIFVSIQTPTVLREKLQEIRRGRERRIPAIALVDESSPLTLQRLFEAGFDSYVVRPLDFQSLYWQIRMSIRLSRTEALTGLTYQIDDLIFDVDQACLIEGKRKFSLTPSQVKILRFFLKHPERIVERGQLRSALGEGRVLSARSLDASLSKLRDVHPVLERRIQSVYGKGYVWSKLPKRKFSAG